ncbi:GNAT family N-acetyltransferase [Sphingomonas sp. LB-2]|uniref:GNAT family N-acetyltransferase n=1 Tax=Sphingomonas caeni TaxID=2984949 RepID=UPI0022321710|nr:GNAT family N-acetyltransferase [Sphingomonas caeni]MCW3846255.1 GNAT family N-acetyltransferase [Sphingomonas caeni]
MEIREGGLDEPAVRDLLRMHLEEVRAKPTPGGAHVLDAIGLRQKDVTFWSAWRDGELLGCSAIRELDPAHGEIKSMRTAPDQLRRGAGVALMTHMLSIARARGYRRLSLETGATPEFDAAQALYRQLGFTYCGAFGDYREDPLSRFMSRPI